MEKRSRRRISDLVAHTASQGLVANENRCARISMMARSANAPPKGRIQKRKTNDLQIITSDLQRTAGAQQICTLFDHLVSKHKQFIRHGEAERLRALEVDDQFQFHRLLHRQIGGLLAL